MAENVIAIGASDFFGIHANFVEQSASTSAVKDYATVLKANGDLSCEVALNNRTNVTGEYGYCGTDIASDLGTLASAMWVEGTYAIDGVTLNFTSSDYYRMSLAGHSHQSNTHVSGSAVAKFNWSGLIAASQGGVGIPTLGTGYVITLTATTSDITAMTLTITPAHIDTLGSDGQHYAGVNTGCRVDLSASGIGPSSDVTADLGANWKLDDASDSDSNTDFDTWAITAHAYIDRT